MSYDLIERTTRFARRVRVLVRQMHKDIANIEDGKQLVRSSGSVGANYIEADGSLSKKDFLMRAKISRKEARESSFWLGLIDCEIGSEHDRERNALLQESVELMKIFGAIIRNSEGRGV